jgi:hypothetical protein
MKNVLIPIKIIDSIMETNAVEEEIIDLVFS